MHRKAADRNLLAPPVPVVTASGCRVRFARRGRERVLDHGLPRHRLRALRRRTHLRAHDVRHVAPITDRLEGGNRELRDRWGGLLHPLRADLEASAQIVPRWLGMRWLGWRLRCGFRLLQNRAAGRGVGGGRCHSGHRAERRLRRHVHVGDGSGSGNTSY